MQLFSGHSTLPENLKIKFMFNIFKKPEKELHQTNNKPKTILCIPGNWNDRSEIVSAIAENNMNEFIFAGMTFKS